MVYYCLKLSTGPNTLRIIKWQMPEGKQPNAHKGVAWFHFIKWVRCIHDRVTQGGQQPELSIGSTGLVTPRQSIPRFIRNVDVLLCFVVVWSRLLFITSFKFIIQCRYIVIFLQYLYERHTIARPWGRGIGCHSWIQSLASVTSVTVVLCAISCYMWSRYIESS